MKCLFCQSENLSEPAGFSICNTCPVQVTYHFTGATALPPQERLIMHGFRVKDPDYDLVVVEPWFSRNGNNVHLQKRFTYESDDIITYKHVLTITLPPQTVTPDNAKYWVNKLLNLLVFS